MCLYLFEGVGGIVSVEFGVELSKRLKGPFTNDVTQEEKTFV